MKIALTGGTGFVGRTLLDMALDEGFDLSALTRRPQPERKRVEWVEGDLANRDALVRLVSDADLVIHVAGVVNGPDARGFEQSNVTGTMNVIDAARTAGLSRMIFVSSLAARQPGLSQYGASKARAEKLVKSSGLDWTIIRPPAVFGPRDTEMLQLFRSAKWGFVPVPKKGDTSVIHVDDLARLLLAMPRGDEEVTGRILEPDDGKQGGWSHYELARAIGHAVGRRPWIIGLSRKAMERAAGLDQFFRGSGAKMTRDRAAYFSHPDWVVSEGAGAPRALWQPQVETREGLWATAEWYRGQGWL